MNTRLVIGEVRAEWGERELSGDESKDATTQNRRKKKVHPVKAYWCNNNFVGVENATQRRSAWMTDLLPESPLYRIILSAWRDTKQYISADCFRQEVRAR